MGASLRRAVAVGSSLAVLSWVLAALPWTHPVRAQDPPPAQEAPLPEEPPAAPDPPEVPDAPDTRDPPRAPDLPEAPGPPGSPDLPGTPGPAGDEPGVVLVRLLELNAAGSLWTPEARALMTGEALQRWQVASIGKLGVAPDTILPRGADRVVARVLGEDGGRRADFYLYLERAPDWKVSAMRTMAETATLAMALQSTEARRDRSPAAQYAVANLRLALKPDAELKAWFEANRRDLDLLMDQARRRLKPSGTLTFDAVDSPTITAKLMRLGLGSIALRPDGRVHVVVGGLLQDTVGFLHCPDDVPPETDPASFIWVEELAARWYLVRTT